ncbi:C4-dicarboxylate transporter DctA [Chiayiivirga flava]|uniref:C4-dicarboxylate transport protein n=1 Tax=Chiayiivirga flava TaxID=659595 RepID=A0A7W8G020_9GAMM|nr:C4-dicarboxylate transporter DctA [Chiayiivirga flava]MBB5207804.1 aerobic C4-dicarboxylate transport protein [Chiayiivirga flava]
MQHTAAPTLARPPRWWTNLYVQVLVAIALGVALGHFRPELGADLKPLGDGFIKLVKMIIAPVIFLTVVIGIAKIGDLRKVGRIGLKALVYFEVLTTLALVLGLLVANGVAPGRGMNVDPAQLDAGGVAQYTQAATQQSTTQFVMNIVPTSFFSPFANGELLQVLLVALLFGIALTRMGGAGRRVLDLCDDASHVFFGIVAMIMRLAPIGAFGAMAFTVGRFGLESLAQLGGLILAVYATCAAFVVVVLGTVARLAGFSLWQFLRFIRGELLLVLGTSSSESALPRLLKRLEELGCDRAVVGLVVPTGYSFNLDGTCIYLTLAAVFVAQALNIDLTLGEQLTLLAVLLLTSKGAAGVTGSGFIVLAATLGALGGKVPVEGVALILGVDRFLSEARAITNFIGNGVAAMVVAKWEGLRDDAQMQRAFVAGPGVDTALPEPGLEAQV